MSRTLPTVAVLGRPNVGKSTFFNRVLGRRQAIVEDVPGVTRDRNFARGDWAGREFWIVDTGGYMEEDEPLSAAVRKQVMAAIEEADVLVLVVDGKAGPTAMDIRIAELLRSVERPIVLAVNKMDRLPNDPSYHDFWSLGLGDPVPVSSISGKGSGDLLDALVAVLPEAPAEPVEDMLQVAVVGRPNVGKSSFVNRMLGEERLVVSEIAGTTRDSIDTPFRYHGRTLNLVDTAGLRRQSKIDPGLEYYASLRTEQAVERADVCLLLIDATEEIHIQDLKVAERALDAGCGLIIVANKWDLVEKDEKTADAYARHIKERAPSLAFVPVLFTSALSGQRIQKALELVLEVAEERTRRVPTAQVNELLGELTRRQPPPHHSGRPVKLLYGTQVAVAPPTFVIFTNDVNGITANYERYLLNGFRRQWTFEGVPLRIRFKSRQETR
ncbi:MAG TPA: ribosome biogenesis GTPase Der [Longimicrobiales bacterium]|nr:ribosome biogenesis GTPase Der [Longimicrobiales bacterium]